MVLAGFMAVSFCVCAASFAYCYAFRPEVSARANGQVRSLSGIMKTDGFKPYFCFVMGCLGLSQLLAACARMGDCVFVLSFGMYVCLTGLIKYDVAFSKRLHFGFVFGLIALGYAFCNAVLLCYSGWNLAACVSYNFFTSVFLLCFLVNAVLKECLHTLQSYLEIAWVLSLNFMLCVYSFEAAPVAPTENSMLLLHVCLALGVAVCALLLGFFYATPGLGYCAQHGVVHCFCWILSMTDPHFSFLLCLVSGLLALCGAPAEEVGLAVVLLFHVCLLGLLSFDARKDPSVCNAFLTGLVLTSVLISLFVLKWDNAWNRVGAVVYLSLTGIWITAAACLWVSRLDMITAINLLQLAWIGAMVFMFGTYVYS